ncbi:MAG: hybrid sensor histidine kinase/response regulator [Planctomycetota bacterium]
MADDRLKYLEIFRAEAREHLDSLSRGLIKLEDRSDLAARPELLKELMRNAHTLKGSSRLLGLAEIGEVAHHMESLLKAMERGERAVDVQDVDLLLEGTDAIQSAVESITSGATIAVEPVVAKLVAAVEAGGRPPTGEDLGSALGALFGDDDESGDDAYRPPGVVAPSLEAEIHDEVEPAAADGDTGRPAGPDTTKLIVPAKVPGDELAAPPGVADAGLPPLKRPTRSDYTDPVMRETMRVEVEQLDVLTDLTGELTIAKSRLENRLFAMRALFGKVLELTRATDEGPTAEARLHELDVLVTDQARRFVEEFGNDVNGLDQLAGDIQSRTMELRMLPVGTIFEPYYRTVRDLRRELHKELELVIEGADTKLDRQLLQEVNPALMHLVRNCCDHGIESPADRTAAGKPPQGRIELRAYQKGANVLIEVRDDGRGLDPQRIREQAAGKGIVTADAATALSDREALELIFRHGFSTSAIITDISGRGVGMNVVWDTLQRLKGDVTIDSVPGEWTCFTLALPLTLSTTVALLVQLGGQIVAIPASFVLSTLRIERAAMEIEGGSTVLRALESVFPVIDLGRFLGFGAQSTADDASAKATVVVVELRGELLGLLVEEVLRFQEVVVKSLGQWLQRVRLVGGATILRKGDPALILNVFDVFQEARFRGAAAQPEAGPAPGRRRHVLVVDDSITTRTIEKSILEQHGYLVDTASSGEEALQRTAGRQYDLVVSDVEMPGITGFELCATLRRTTAYRETPVIIVTSLSRPEDKQRGVDAGANAYIVKGTFKQEVLLETVRSLIG